MKFTTELAIGLGSSTEQAMTEPRQIQQRLWLTFAGGAPWRYTSLATKARCRGQATIVIALR